MNKYIIVDTFGNDYGPLEIIKGCNLALSNYSDLHLILVGDEEIIKANITDLNRIEIIHTKEFITNNENVMDAFFTRTNASITLAIKKIKDSNYEFLGLITPGNSGALLMGTMRYLNHLENYRPCLGAILPTVKHTFTCLVDVGATIDCSPNQLHQFAKLGKICMQKYYHQINPRIGLLSNGVEPSKGNKLVKETYQLLSNDDSLNFVGNIEGNRALSGDVDVLVADGFDGNQILKVSEGSARNIIEECTEFIKNNHHEECLPLLDYIKSRFDLPNLGGALILGIDQNLIKIRGNSSYLAVNSAVEMLLNIDNNDDPFKNK